MAKILLVEDDTNLREIYEARLQAEGYTIVSANDGEEALVVAKQEKPDLIIADVMMPRISGFEMLDILRNTEGLKDVKIIMLTALSQAEDKSRADKLGADRYLVKSQVTLEDIVKNASDILNSIGAAPEGGQAAPAAPAAAAPTPAPTAPVSEPSASPAGAPAEPPTAQPIAPVPAPEPAAAPAPTMPVATPPAPAPPTPAPKPAPPAMPATPIPVTMPPTAAPAAKPAAQPVPSTDAATVSESEKVMKDAVKDLLADNAADNAATSVTPAPQPAPAPAAPTPAAPAVPAAPPTPPATATTAAPAQPQTPATPPADEDSVRKKVIQPLNPNVQATQNDLTALLAKEGITDFDKDDQAGFGDIDPNASTPHPPGHVISPNPSNSQSGQSFDPNSISL